MRNPLADIRVSMIAIALGASLLLTVFPAFSDPVADSNPQARADDHHSGSPAWQRTLRLVREPFPDMPRVTTKQLADIQADAAISDIVLLDAKLAAEFSVSHLPGAVLGSNAHMALDALEASDSERTIVVYCSVGYPSARLAATLRARGPENVFNLEGSLFQCANENRPLHRGAERVYQAHRFDQEWGKLLDQRFWSN